MDMSITCFSNHIVLGRENICFMRFEMMLYEPFFFVFCIHHLLLLLKCNIDCHHNHYFYLIKSNKVTGAVGCIYDLYEKENISV